MILVRALEGIPGDLGPTAVAIGKFDGLHSGHRQVLAALLEDAAPRGLAPVVLTFDRNPLAVLDPARRPPDLVSLDQKLELLAGTGVAATVVLPFTDEFAHLSPEEFVQQVLVDALAAKLVLVGSDFRFGSKGSGDTRTLEELGARSGFEVRIVEDVLLDGERASSSRIRRLVASGDVAAAARLLGRDPSMRGTIVHGLKRGREMGYPTANLAADSEGLAPAHGVYAGWLVDFSVPGTPRYPAAISVGTNPTFDDVEVPQVEAYVLDADLDLYGHLVEVQFTKRLRGMVAYTGIGPLIEQMARDVDEARGLLGTP